MADVNEAAMAEKHVDKHNTGEEIVNKFGPLTVREATNRSVAPVDTRPPNSGGSDTVGSSQPPPVRPLIRADSRSTFSPQSLRQANPSQVQPRPQFVPGGPVTGPQAFVARPGAPPLRGPVPPGAQQQTRPIPPPLRPFGPQSIGPQQGPRPQSPTLRAPPPNSLQFGPRQPTVGSGLTPDGSRPQTGPQINGAYKNGVQFIPDQLPRQSSQGSLKGIDTNFQNKPVNLENQTDNKNENQNGSRAENGIEGPGVAKGRSFSIAAAPGAPSPLKGEDDRRKSVSAIGGRIDEFAIRSPGLGLIQEVKTDSKDNIRESKESLPSEPSNEGKDISDRPDSRLSGSKMTESFIGALPIVTAAKKIDDDDDVILQNNQTDVKNATDATKTRAKEDLSDRSPSLTRSDDSPEPKQITVASAVPTKSHNGTPEPRPKTPKAEIKTEAKPEIKSDINKEAKLAATPNKIISKSPIPDTKPMTPVAAKKPNELNMTITSESKKSTPRKVASAPKSRPKDGDNDSGVDESTQGNDMNGSPGSPNKKLPSKLPMKEKSSNSLKTSLSRSSSKSAAAKTPENPSPAEKKKVPMNKVQVGNAPSPNLKAVKSKIGSLDNAAYKPGGGKIKIENRKLEFGNITPKIAAKNDAYTPSGGSKKIITTKLEWNARPKVGSLQNAAYKPGGGDKKIETVKLDFSEKAKPKVGSTANITHKPGGGAIKIENQKLEFKAQSKVGSLDNVKHKPGGGEIKIFEDKEYIKQMSGQSPVPTSRSHSRQEDEYYASEHEWMEDRPKSRCRSARTPRTPRALSPRRRVYGVEDDVVHRNNERNRRTSRPASARDPPRSACSRRSSLTKRPAFTIY